MNQKYPHNLSNKPLQKRNKLSLNKILKRKSKFLMWMTISKK